MVRFAFFRKDRKEIENKNLDNVVSNEKYISRQNTTTSKCSLAKSWYLKIYDKLKGILKVGYVRVNAELDNKCIEFEGKYKWIKGGDASTQDLKSTLDYLLQNTNGDFEKAADLSEKLKEKLFKMYAPSLNYFDLAYHILKGTVRYDESKKIIYIDKDKMKKIYNFKDERELDEYINKLVFRTRLLFGGDQKGKSYESLLNLLKNLENIYKKRYKKRFNKKNSKILFKYTT